MNKLSGTSHLPCNPIFIRMMLGVMYETRTSSGDTSAPSSGMVLVVDVKLPFCADPAFHALKWIVYIRRPGGQTDRQSYCLSSCPAHSRLRQDLNHSHGSHRCPFEPESTCPVRLHPWVPEAKRGFDRLYELSPALGKKQTGSLSTAPPVLPAPGMKQQPLLSHSAAVMPKEPAKEHSAVSPTP